MIDFLRGFLGGSEPHDVQFRTMFIGDMFILLALVVALTIHFCGGGS